jgi:hypothetical protein
MYVDDITLELARIEREAMERIRQRIASQQLGEAFEGIEDDEAA